jgi:hypothetical protein
VPAFPPEPITPSRGHPETGLLKAFRLPAFPPVVGAITICGKKLENNRPELGNWGKPDGLSVWRPLCGDTVLIHGKDDWSKDPTDTSGSD